MHRPLLTAALAICAVPASAADADLAVTIYRSDGGALFEGGGSPVADGYALVHERRSVNLKGGKQTVVVDGLPSTLDPEAVAVDLGGSVRVLGQRVLSAGDAGLLAAHRGEQVVVGLPGNGGSLSGTLISSDGGGIGVREANGSVVYVRDYSSIRFIEGGLPGSTLQVSIDGGAGVVDAALSYPTSGLGWRAAYAALLLPGNDCRLRLDALASIANRSGRDYPAARLKLVAGEPAFAKPSGPRPMMMKAAMAVQSDELPEQSALGDYRSYAIAGTLDLPDASVTQVPLYAPRELACQRSWVYESGSAWYPPKPMREADVLPRNRAGAVVGQLRFDAAENLPAGYLRVLGRDRGGQTEFLGEARIADTPKGRAVDVTLGNAFDLGANSERTAFSLDKAARTMSESFRIRLSNGGETARNVIVREHPNRWRQWSVTNATQKPSRQTPDALEFVVAVPAGGNAVLDYTVSYAWTAGDE